MIKHKFKFTASLENADGHISAAIPIVIADVSPEDESALPSYEDAWKSAPCDSQQVANLIARGSLLSSIAIYVPNAAATVANSTLSSSDTEDEESSTRPLTPTSTQMTDPWEDIDLSRVPSYTTAIRSNRLYSFSGTLPGYESVVATPGRTRG
ncbi:hypothetical protein RMATCC62417_15088 [Rhizopus microsporus]|nr:hypothetical protein RMATCC62417_15088 [Rhizopus microsporus]